jgi:hypothetical protein
MVRVAWVVVRTRPGRRFVYAAVRNRSVRRSVRSRQWRSLMLTLIDDDRVRGRAFDALDRDSVRTAVLAEVDRRWRARPFVTRQVSQTLNSRDRRVDLRRALDRPDVRRAVGRAANEGGPLASLKVVWVMAGLRLRDLMR